MSRIALLGTGLLGSGMVRRFLAGGTPVTVWNRTPAKAQALAADGATVAASPAADGADHIHIVVSDDAVVDGVLEQIVPALKAGAIVIDHSTTLPEGTTGRVERMRARGVRFLHAPVFMSPQMATEGKGVILISGPQAEYDEVRAELEGMTGDAWYLGERPDLAAAYKLFGNAMLFAISGGLADIITMARANAIDPIEALTLFTHFQVTNAIAFRGPKMARGETMPPSFEISMARKDVRLMTESARGETLVVLPGVARRMDDLVAAGRGHEDIAAIAPADAPPRRS